MHYHHLGKFPHKRHIQFRKPDGSLYNEQLFSTEGFSNVYSTLYHNYPPTMVTQIGDPVSVAPKVVNDRQLKPRSLQGFKIKPEDDFLESRKPVFVNDETKIVLAAPRKSMTSYFYKNGDSDECIFIHVGSGTLKTMYGNLKFEYLREFSNIKFFYGDGYKGLPTYAPFDRIIITAAAPFIPTALMNQLKIGGKLVVPLGEGNVQQMQRITKTDVDKVKIESFENFSFVPMLQGKNT